MGIAGKPLYEELLGFAPTHEHLDQIAAVRAQAQQKIADDADGLIFVKTHQAMVVDRGHPTINFSVTAGAIYIVRNPLDVAISIAHHAGLSVDAAIDFMGLKNAETPVSEKQVYEVYGSWSQHVLSWTRKQHPAIYIMRYEDMLNDPQKTFGGLARHLLFDPSADELVDAVKHSSFEQLKEQEEKEGFRERPERAQAFFREGRAGQWKEILTPQQIERICNDHREQMERFGYMP